MSTRTAQAGFHSTQEQAAEYARSLLEASLDPLVTIGPQGKITDVNQATELVTGIPRQRLIGTDFSDYFTEPDKARAGYQQVFSQGFVRDYPLVIRHTVRPAADGAEGLQAAQGQALDLILCDIHLPKMDGFEVARLLKANPAFADVPLIGVTALAMVGDREDSPPNLQVFRDTLQPSGYAVIEATSIGDGLALARQRVPDLIVSDLHLHKESGFDFLKAIKADDGLRSIPFLYLSSTALRTVDQQHGLDLGAVCFLIRPIEPQTLLAEIAACLRERKKLSHGDHSGS